MWEIIHQCGGFLLDALALMVLFAFLFGAMADGEGHTGIIDIVSAKIPDDAIDYFDYTDFDAFASESAKTKPEIVYTMGDVTCGDVDLYGGFLSYDSDAKLIGMKILCVTGPNGDDIAPLPDGEFGFYDAGVYTVMVSAVDGGGRKTVSEVSIPVNR